MAQEKPVIFTGLSLSSGGGELPPGGSPVFHNCDIAPDGDVVRRPGSNFVINIEENIPGSAWSTVVKTRKGTEYLVTVTQTRIVIQLCRESSGAAFTSLIISKSNIFKRTVTDVNFVLLSAPYDRLLILTENHPPIQLSFLERTLSFTCTNAGTQSITAPSLSTDSKLWNDNTTTGTFLVNFNTNALHLLGTKSPGFTMTVPGLGMALNEVRDFTLVQISWQWWAESLIWKGQDFSQNTMRYSVTAIDQNVKIPLALTTDLDPRYLDSAYRGITLSNSNNFIAFPPIRLPSTGPATTLEWSHGSGQRYNYDPNIPPSHTPFFATWQTIEPAGTQTPVTFWRARELRFNANTGVRPDNMQVYVGGVMTAWRSAVSATHNLGDYITYADTYTTQRNLVTVTSASTLSTGIFMSANGRPVTPQSEIIITNVENKWLGVNARNVLYTDLPSSGGTLDGCYVPAFGYGAFADYFRGRFTPFGCLFRDRLVLRTSDESIDQLLLSATSDTITPGNFYNFFQITDALEGVVDDPFTINITAKSREKITALLGWQQSLFVFTSVSTYAINGGEVFGPDAFTTGLVASYGAFNTRCVVATNLTVLFLNRFGLFDLLNKNNTTDYGSYERSEPVRPVFLNVVIPPNQDALPWVALNDTNNKVYIGLPSATDTNSCERILSLNLSWNSWSTINGITPFNVCSATQLLNWTMFIVKSSINSNINLLQMDATHNLDYAINLNEYNLASPVLNYPQSSDLTTVDINGLVANVNPSPPLLREFTLPSKDSTNYYSTPLTTPTLTPRNWMFDIPDLAPFLGSDPEGGIPSPYVMHNELDPYPLYPRISASSSTSITFTPPVSPAGVTRNTVDVLGTIYPSIFASTTFNTASLGRLKRLKRLHLLFDNTSVRNTRYYFHDNKQINSAVIIINYNYGEGEYVADAQLIGDYLRFDALHLNTTPSALPREQLSIPLSGYGCDYQLYVCSTGGDAFKLTAFEFDVEPQRTKTYVRE